jgi:hypothetical protein
MADTPILSSAGSPAGGHEAGVVQLTSRGTAVPRSAIGLENLRGEFAKCQYVRLRNLIEQRLLDRIAHELDRGEFHQRVHKNVGVELCLATNSLAMHLLRFLVNTPRLFEIVRLITSCGRIGCFDGRIYRMLPGSDHYDSWHDDMADERMIGMSINLSVAVYQGGVFQLRNLKQNTERHVPNTGYGDAILFQLADDLRHRVTAVEGIVPKTAFAGWFCARPEYLSIFKQTSSLDVHTEPTGSIVSEN